MFTNLSGFVLGSPEHNIPFELTRGSATSCESELVKDAPSTEAPVESTAEFLELCVFILSMERIERDCNKPRKYVP